LPQTNLHATALLLDDRGVLICGPSGAGKTTLALALISQFTAAGRFARLVADDQLFARVAGNRLIVSCPPAIAGMVEVNGLGPRRLPHRDCAVIDLVVTLVGQAEAPRYQEPQSETVLGVVLPRLELPARNATAAALVVLAALDVLPST
jgi:serine kinase of HPr protein (carbohydrate metabolism regulator)